MSAAELKIDLALKRAEFSLELSEVLSLDGVTALSGPSASGKTTILRIISGLEDRARGTLSFDGETWQGNDTWRAPHKRQIGYVFQDARLFAHLNVAENLRFGLRWQDKNRNVPADLIDALDLGPLMSRSVAALSGGEARRVALGRALATRPRLMLLDEPLTGLDAARKARLLPFIARALKTAGCPAIYVSHDLAETNALADRKLHLSGGRIVARGAAGPVFSARVVGSTAGQAILEFAGQRFGRNGSAPTGNTVSFRIDEEHVHLSAHDPGEGSAHFVCRVIAEDVGKDSVSFRFDQRPELPLLAIQRSKLGGFCPISGQTLWLSVANIVLLPD